MGPVLRAPAVFLAAAVLAAAGPRPGVAADSGASTELRFVRDGALVRRIDRPTLERSCAVTTITIDDPYYGHRKAFRACPLGEVLALGFGAGAPADGVDVLFRARDGYAKPALPSRLREDGGWLAFADAERDPAWEPIDRRQIDPAPYYLVWTAPHQRDTHQYPWPYQLVEIELTSIERTYPHTVPRSAPRASPAWEGFAVFRTECIACHAINGEGGKVGPDLNVPRSIVEYRPVEQVKAYIRDPATFRYTSMPAHLHLTPAQLDGLVAYFGVMRTLKHDPVAGSTPAAGATP